MKRIGMIIGALPLVLCAAAPQAWGQGSQRAIGGGCSNRTAPLVSGPLAIGTTVQVDTPACFLGQGGFGFLLLGFELPPAAWVPIWLDSTISGRELCDLVVNPVVPLDVTNLRFPLTFPIPRDPSLVGGTIALQSFCRECGFAGCFTILTQGLALTIG